jgi:glycosyltransferase involved in cell wall biosynthesis
MKPLRHVGMNAVFLRPAMGGMESYVRSLLPQLLALRPDLRFTVFVNPKMRETLAGDPWTDGVRLVTHPLIGRKYTTALSELALLGRLVDRARVELLHNLAMTAPLRTEAVTVVTVPDLIWLSHPDSMPRVTTSIWRAIVPPLARRADHVLTFSDASRDDIVRKLNVPYERVDVVPLGPGSERVAEPTTPDELRERFRLGAGPIVLSLSAKVRHKNLLRLLEAMVSVRASHPGAVLVLPGNPTPYEHVLKDAAGRLGVASNVRFLGWINGSDLEGFYRASTCFVYPSLKEGFGLPVLEAMKRGVPVSCSRASSLQEVAGDAARYFDPSDAADIGSAVAEVLADPELRNRLIAAGREQQRRFTWKATAEGTLAAYERAWSRSRAGAGQ